MKTIDQVVKYESRCLDGRDKQRLADFITEEKLPFMGMELKEEFKGKHQPKPFTREEIIKQMKNDVEFGFEKALNRRGISSYFMFEVVRMWNWILEEGLEDFPDEDYTHYGLPLFKATALKYGFDNPIGDDVGNEHKYSEESDD